MKAGVDLNIIIFGLFFISLIQRGKKVSHYQLNYMQIRLYKVKGYKETSVELH